jgi:hypothetical protein
LVIANGRIHSDAQIGKHTFHNSNGESVVDYLLFNYNDLQYIEHFDISSPNEFSDHCAILFSLQHKTIHTLNRDCNNELNERYISWDDSRANDFNTCLINDSAILNQITNRLSTDNIEESIISFTSYLQTHAFNIFGKYKKHNTTNTRIKQPWFDINCIKARK